MNQSVLIWQKGRFGASTLTFLPCWDLEWLSRFQRRNKPVTIHARPFSPISISLGIYSLCLTTWETDADFGDEHTQTNEGMGVALPWQREREENQYQECQEHKLLLSRSQRKGQEKGGSPSFQHCWWYASAPNRSQFRESGNKLEYEHQRSCMYSNVVKQNVVGNIFEVLTGVVKFINQITQFVCRIPSSILSFSKSRRP